MSDSNERAPEVAHVRTPSVSNMSMNFQEFISKSENQELVKQISDGLGQERFAELQNDKNVTVENVKNELEAKMNYEQGAQQMQLSMHEEKTSESKEQQDPLAGMDALSQNIPGIIQALEKAFAEPEAEKGAQEQPEPTKTAIEPTSTEKVAEANPGEIGNIAPTPTPKQPSNLGHSRSK